MERIKMNEKAEKINATDEFLLKKASELYSVPYEVLAGAYRMGRNDGYLKGLEWMAK